MTDTTREIFDTAEDLASHVAAELVATVARVQADDLTPQIVLTGGTVADRIHRAVAASPGDVDWHDVEFWWGDERFVPEDDEDRNAKAARSAMLDHLGVREDAVHEMPAADGREPEAAALLYAEEIRHHPAGRFDVVMLGLGPDGHVASVFPGHPSFRDTDDAAYAVADSPKPPADRITLSLTALNEAAEVWFVVSGEAKADAVQRVLAGDESLPGAHVRGTKATRWFLDAEAASRL